MRIQHNVSALNAHRNLTFNNNNVQKNLEKLSSGYRVNRAGDDAAGLAISEKMRAQINGLQVAQKNAQDGISLIQTSEGALNETHVMLRRMRELAMQSENGVYSDADERAKMNAEVTALKDEITRTANTLKFNGITLLDGSMKNLTLAIDSDGSSLGVTVTDMTATGLKINNTKVDTQANAKAAIKTIDDAIGAVSTQRSTLGALQNRLEHTIQSLSVAEENLTASESRIRDTDMAKEMMDFTKNNILNQAAQSMLAQANMQPQGVLSLLQ